MSQYSPSRLVEAERESQLFERLARYDGFEEVEVTARDGTLLLRGFVDSYELKRRLEETAREMGFTDIDDAVRVMPCDR
jgi:osmotically-inducible protein OsmY